VSEYTVTFATPATPADQADWDELAGMLPARVRPPTRFRGELAEKLRGAG